MNLAELFARDYQGEPFVLFGPAHLVALALILAVNVGIVARRRQLQGVQRSLRVGLATVLLVNEAGWHLWNWATGQWTVQTMLPLHLCSVLVFLSAALLLTGHPALYEVCYLLGIGGALQALLTPDAGIYGFPHYRAFQTFISHGSIVTAAVLMTAVAGLRPYLRSIWRVALTANLYMAAVGVVNAALGSNYLYIARKPETASVLDLLPPWPWYILHIELIGLITMLLLYAPFAVRDRLARRRAAVG